RHVPCRPVDVPCDGRARARGADALATGRDRRRRRPRRAGRRRFDRGPSLRRSRLRPLSARMKAKLSTDGGARGNPGPAAYGYVLEAEDGTVLDARGEKIGVATNNVAEYRALVAGLEKALELGID